MLASGSRFTEEGFGAVGAGSLPPAVAVVSLPICYWCSDLWGIGMCESELDLEDGSTSELSGQWTDGWSTNSSDEDDSNGSEEMHTNEGDSGPSEYQGCDGGGCDVAASTEDHGNSGNIMSEQFSGPDPVNGFALLSAEFIGIEDAYTRYVAYAKDIGFVMRKGDSVKDEDGNIVRKFFYCNRKWRTKALVEKHNHDLASPAFTNVMQPHRKITEGHKAHIHSMHEAGFQTTQIMGFFAHMCGGYRNLNFISKDLYNYMDGVRQSRIVEGDVAATISYMKGKVELDPMAVVQYTYCAEKHLGHMFWSDGHMQHDYECFGTNHHRQTIIFVFYLLEDKKILSYKWLLSSFLEVMRHKEPKVVVTDGDESMRKEIRNEFPYTTHRICTWHLARNAVVNIKDKDFCAAFKTAVYGHFDVEEFDNYWADMVTSFGLGDNDLQRHTKRERCGQMLTWVENFVPAFELLLGARDYRSNEFIVDYKTLYSNPVMNTGLETKERSASKLDSFGSTEKFMFRKFRRPHHVYSVFLDRSCDKYACSCKLWERLGIPCRHIFCVLKELEKEELPNQLVLRKWCKDAKVAGSNGMDAASDPTEGVRVRYGALWSACLSMCFQATKTTEIYNIAMMEVARMSREFESLCVVGQSERRVQAAADQSHVRDPKVVRSNGEPRRSMNGNKGRRCRWCFGLGHDRRNCTAMDDDVDDEAVMLDLIYAIDCGNSHSGNFYGASMQEQACHDVLASAIVSSISTIPELKY
ncbi:hypothetical protein AHAS_Ahas17G0167000 [Arachis hypogaea]